MLLPWRDVSIGDGPPFSTSIHEDEAAVLAKLAQNATVLEIGAAYGYSAILMATAGARSVLSVDPHMTHRSLPAMAAACEVYGVADVVTIWCAYSQDVLPMLVKSDRRFDLIFIDGDHTFDAVRHDVLYSRRLLDDGGILACHDYDEATCPGVKQALDYVFGGPGDLTQTLAVYRGLASQVYTWPEVA